MNAAIQPTFGARHSKKLPAADQEVQITYGQQARYYTWPKVTSYIRDEVSYSLSDQPLTIGDIVSVGIRQVRWRAKTIISCFLLPSILTSVAWSSFQWSWSAAQSNVNQPAFWPIIAAMVACVMVLAWANCLVALRGAALVQTILMLAPDFEFAWKNVKRRWLVILSVYLMCWILLPFAGVYCMVVIISGTYLNPDTFGIFRYPLVVIELLLSLFIVVIGTLFWTMNLIVVSSENISFAAVFRRTYEIVTPNFGRGIRFMLLLIAVVLLFYVALAGPFSIAWALDWRSLVSDTPMPFYLCVVEVVQQFISNMLQSGLLLVGLALYYRDCRLRLEGTDLIDRLEGVARISS